MKFILLTLLVAAVAAAPKSLDDDNQAVELIVNPPKGQALELGDNVFTNLKEHYNGLLAASSDLHPFSAVSIAEAAAAAEALVPTLVQIVESPKHVAQGEFVPSVIVASAIPAVAPVQPVLIPSKPVPSNPEVILSPVVLSNSVPIIPSDPEVKPPTAVLPEPAAQISSELFDHRNAQVQVNDQDPGILSTLTSWFNMVVNYFNKDDLQLSSIV